MIELHSLSCAYSGKTILDGIDLCLYPGKVTVLLGQNGSGKTTLIKTVIGLIPASGGSVLIDGEDSRTFSPQALARKVAYMAQSRNVPNIVARTLVLHGRFPYISYPRRYRAVDYALVDAALQEADAIDIADRPVQELSGGQRQKIYLAMALAQDTDTVFMDEPTSFLDARHQLELMRLARNLADRGKSVVMVLHDLCLAMKHADLLVVLDGGRLLHLGTPEEIYAGGLLDKVFGVSLGRVMEDGIWHYYYR